MPLSQEAVIALTGLVLDLPSKVGSLWLWCKSIFEQSTFHPPAGLQGTLYLFFGRRASTIACIIVINFEIFSSFLSRRFRAWPLFGGSPATFNQSFLQHQYADNETSGGL